MKIKCLSCEALTRIIYYCAAQSPHMVDISLNQIGLHNQPGELRNLLQQDIDAQNGKGYDVIALAYGLCGLATAGLVARETPLVMPRAHDCITLFLGDRQRYKEQIESCPGTYWYAQDNIERGRLNSGTNILWGLGSEGDNQNIYEKYVEKYGQDNADYLMQVLSNWQSSYQRGVYIDIGVGEGEGVEDIARQESIKYGWQFEKISGDLVLIHRLLSGDWEDDFLVIQPGQMISMGNGDEIITSQDGANIKTSDQ